MPMQLQFLGAAGTVTGSCYLLDTANARIMVDCGMFQGPKEIRERNYGNFLVPPGSVDYILLTHAHIDHSGLIPKFVKNGFRGRVIATEPTVELCEILLPDSGHIQEMEIERKNRKNRRANKPLIAPVYNVQDAYDSLSYFSMVHYNEIVQLTPEIRVRFVDAGHILASAMIEVWVKEEDGETKLVFSGDIGRKHRPLIKDPSIIQEADYVIMESTYGNRRHEQAQDEKELLHDVIWETYKKGGNLIIPAFAVERTQDLLYHLNVLTEEKRLPPMDIYIDSPLSTLATAIFKRSQISYFDLETFDLVESGAVTDFFQTVKFTKTVAESMSLNNVKGAIIISASGMCEAGRIRHHLKYNLWRPESTVLFVGYQAAGTLGRLILDKEETVRIFGDAIAVRADIRSIGYSAHADQAELLEWVKGFQTPPREVFIVHGEPASSSALADLIRAELSLNVTVPTWRQTVTLDAPVSAARVTEPAAAAPLRKVYEALSLKLGRLLELDLEAAQREEIIRRMSDLDVYLSEELGKSQ